jgi:alkanesulfonate monooxygenase SsuD/methylene tetrahydromethanopterin reductase-like flavin-dependent oxidoreductase (luciferase family)
MRVGVTLFAQNYSDWDRFIDKRWDDEPVISDGQIYAEEIAIGKLVEPLGFDSLWSVEHHFTPYTMDNHPLQFLSYFAGMTERIDFGTMVTVLPWHDPLRVAEQAAMLDCMLQGAHRVRGAAGGVRGVAAAPGRRPRRHQEGADQQAFLAQREVLPDPGAVHPAAAALA